MDKVAAALTPLQSFVTSLTRKAGETQKVLKRVKEESERVKRVFGQVVNAERKKELAEKRLADRQTSVCHELVKKKRECQSKYDLCAATLSDDEKAISGTDLKAVFIHYSIIEVIFVTEQELTTEKLVAMQGVIQRNLEKGLCCQHSDRVQWVGCISIAKMNFTSISSPPPPPIPTHIHVKHHIQCKRWKYSRSPHKLTSGVIGLLLRECTVHEFSVRFGSVRFGSVRFGTLPTHSVVLVQCRTVSHSAES